MLYNIIAPVKPAPEDDGAFGGACCFKARKNAMTRARERERERERKRERENALQGWEGVELMTVVEWCVCVCQEHRIGRKFHKRGEELRNDRSANLSLVETDGREIHR